MASYRAVVLNRALFFQISAFNTSPSPPPLMTLLQSLVVAMAVTPILWALLMTYISRPVSGAKARILPSFHAGMKGKQKAGRISICTLSPQSAGLTKERQAWRVALCWRKETSSAECWSPRPLSLLQVHPMPSEGGRGEEKGGRPTPTSPMNHKTCTPN